ncbi:MAG: PA domain-containing protein, partial [Candidatus Eisenbacteria bacterium]
MGRPSIHRNTLLAVVGAALLIAVSAPAHAVSIVIVNADGAGEGFNDPTVVAPVGGNTGTTVGQQRLIVFQTAANIWGSLLPGTQVIHVNSQFNALSCGATSGVLGSAGPATIIHDFTGAEFPGYWYNVALANQESNSDQNGSTAEINATFNSSVGIGGCLTGSSWYYGLDDNEGATGIDLLVVILHEMGHGLGFLTTTDGSTGNFQGGFPALWDKFLYDETTGLHWDQETAVQRQASAISLNGLVWDGKAVNFMVPHFMSNRPRVTVSTPVSIAGDYAAGTATFGAALSTGGVTAPVVLAVDTAAPTSDGCTAFTNAAQVAGNIAFVDRGTCTFAVKAEMAQAAGAVGVIIANNVA